MKRRLVCAAGLLIIGAACTAHPNAVRPITTTAAGDTVYTVAQAEQPHAPALAASGEGIVAAWVGADERGVHHDARRFNGAAWGDIVTLPLPPEHPYDQRLIAGDGGGLHLFWLDAADGGETHLWSAWLAADLAVERGPVDVSGGLALRYSAVPDGDGGAWLAWSGGLLAELNVYLRHLDAEGRPLQAVTVAADAENPALVRTDAGEIWLLWTAGGQLMRQRIMPPDAAGAQPLTAVISFAPGDRLINTGAALDATTAYFYWNIARRDGIFETWITSGGLAAESWRPPSLLRRADDSTLSLFAPLTASITGQRETLTATAQRDDGVGLVELRGGDVIRDELILPDLRLVGLPMLIADALDRRYVAWAQPGTTTADLQLLALP